MKLEKCPFCGGDAKVVEHKFNRVASTYGVMCKVCRSETAQFYPTMAEAVKAWNRRTNEQIH